MTEPTAFSYIDLSPIALRGNSPPILAGNSVFSDPRFNIIFDGQRAIQCRGDLVYSDRFGGPPHPWL